MCVLNTDTAAQEQQRCAIVLPPLRQHRYVHCLCGVSLCLALWSLLLQASPSKPEPGVGTCNLYFKAPAAPFPDNILYLNGTGQGLVNNCCFPSTVAPSYAPPGQVSTVKRH